MRKMCPLRKVLKTYLAIVLGWPNLTFASLILHTQITNSSFFGAGGGSTIYQAVLLLLDNS